MTPEPKDYEVAFWGWTIFALCVLGAAALLGCAALLVMSIWWAVDYTVQHGLTPGAAEFFLILTVATVGIALYAASRWRKHRTFTPARKPFGPHFNTTPIFHGKEQS